jgi:methyl-accepting chemotaxis protein
MLANTTIKVRVIAAFAVVLLSTIGLGLFAVQRLSAVNAAAKDVSENWLPAANYLGDLSQDFEYYRSVQGQVLMTSGDMRRTKLSKMAEAEKKMAADYESYNATVESPDERALADAIKDGKAAYLAMGDSYLQKVNTGDTAGALDEFTGAMQPVVDRLRAAIRKDRDFQVTQGHAVALKGEKLGRDASTLIITVLAITAAVCLLIGFLMIRTISLPIRKMSDVMGILARGDTSVTIPNAGERSEIGDMAKAVEVFKDGMIRNKALELEAAEAREQAETERKQTMVSLADQFENAVGGIVEMVSSAATEMQATASQLSASAQESAAQATSVSAAAEEAGTNVTSVAGAAEELGASVAEIGRQVELSLQKARDAVNEADATAAIVYQLSEAAARINSIVEMISGIASQTNLLALNATIESARAGEAGRGFAVVATEVKALAQQTAKATDDINAQVAGIQATTRQAVEAIEGFTRTIRAISDTSTTIAAAVEQQGAATQEIVQAVNQASIGTAEVTSNITGVARMAEETGSGANQVLGASSELAEQAANLRNQVQGFLSQVRAA